LQVTRLCGSGNLTVANFSALTSLASFDSYMTVDIWERVVQEYGRLSDRFPNRAEAMLEGAKALLAAAPTAGDLPGVAYEVMHALVRPALPDSGMFFIRVGEGFSRRMTVARSLLRDLVVPAQDTQGRTFASSHHLLADMLLGLTPFVECLLTSLSPWVWGLSVGRAGAVLIITFGKPVLGRSRIAGDILDMSARSASVRGTVSWEPEAEQADYEHSIRWWLARIDLLFSHLTEPANCAIAGLYDPRIAHERAITAVQIFKSCHMIATTRDQHTRQLLLFNVLDQLPGLDPRAKWEVTTSVTKARQRLAEIEERMPADVARVLLPRARVAVEALEHLADGFFAPEIVQDDAILLPDKWGGQVATPLSKAASEWLRVMRNSAHGFEQKVADRQRVLLAAHDASVPPELPDVAWLHLLHLLCYPEKVAAQGRARRAK